MIRRWISRTARILMYSLGGLIATAVILVLAVAIWPQLLVNERTLRFAAMIAEGKGISIHWKSLGVEVGSITLLRKRFGLQAKELCVRIKDEGISGCTSRFQFSVMTDFSSFVPKLTRVEQMNILDLQWKALPQKVSGVFNLQDLKGQQQEFEKDKGWDYLVWGSTKLPDRSRVQAQAFVNWDGKLFLNGNSNKTKNDDLGYLVSGSYQKGKARLVLGMEGAVNPDRFSGKLSAAADHWDESLPRIAVRDCHLNLHRKAALEKASALSRGGQIQIDCPIRLSIPMPPLPYPKEDLQLPTELGLTLTANVGTSEFPPTPDSRISGPVEAKINPVLTPLFQGEGEFRAQVRGIPSEFPQNWKIDTTDELTASIPHFETLVEKFRTGPWAIPAPFHVLRGPVKLKVSGKSDLENGEFPVKLKTRLSSQTESLSLNGAGTLKIFQLITDPKPRFDFVLLLSDVQLQLPRLDLAAPPPLFPDDRIRTSRSVASTDAANTEKKNQNESPFHYRISIRTRPDRPAQLKSNLAKGPVPVHVNFSLSDSEPVRGQIRVESFPVDFFRRKASLQYFRLNLLSPVDESPLEGSIRVEYVDYVISIRIQSTLGKPRVSLFSEPPLPENQLVAVLLFGRPLEELEPDQSASVGSTRAALMDGALGLASLYVLASTPIQSIGYDPRSGIVSAKIRLGEGTSLNLGTDASSTSSIGIRRRLSANWAITTTLSSSSEAGGVASANLEWSRRY